MIIRLKLYEILILLFLISKIVFILKIFILKHKIFEFKRFYI
jgi:hypothetical protein